MPNSTVDQLVEECLVGSQAAWNELVRRYAPLVWAIARSHRLSRTDCEDVSQATWMQVVKHLTKLRAPDRFAEWLAVTAKRESLKHLPRVARHVPSGDSTAFDRRDESAPDPEAAAVGRDRDTLVLRALRDLPPRDQALLGLLMCDPPRSYDEISVELGIPRGSIGPFRARSLVRLERRLRELGEDVPG